MYRRYSPNQTSSGGSAPSQNPPACPPNSRASGAPPQNPKPNNPAPQASQWKNARPSQPQRGRRVCRPAPSAPQKNEPNRQQSNHNPPPKREKIKLPQNPISGLIPSALYNPESKKVLGLFSAEDLLLAALIFILMENDENDDPMLIYALLYVLLSDYIDLPF